MDPDPETPEMGAQRGRTALEVRAGLWAPDSAQTPLLRPLRLANPRIRSVIFSQPLLQS